MGFVPPKALVLIKLSVLLLSCFSNVFGDEVDTVSWAQSPHHHAPSYPPIEAPEYHWGHPPSHHHHHKGQSPSHPPIEAPEHHWGHPPSHHHHHKGQSPSHPPVEAPEHHWGHPPSHHHHKGQSPSHPPIEAPEHHWGHPPSHPPSYHHLPTRSLVAVQGVVYCKSCKYIGVDTLLGASPLLGAVVRLQCNNTKYPLVEEAKTDKNGYFFIMAPKKITTYGSHKCKAFLVSSPLATCSKPTNLNDGLKGAILMPPKPPLPPPSHPLPFQIFSVGPFAFEPSGKVSCKP